MVEIEKIQDTNVKISETSCRDREAEDVPVIIVLRRS